MLPTLFTIISFWLWILLFLVWIPGYFVSKPSVGSPNYALQVPMSILFGACFLLFFTPDAFGLGEQITAQTFNLGMVGVILSLAGTSLAIWGRATLGTNWSGTATGMTKGHEFIERGPYAFVRHPIYSGMMVAMIGTALTIGTVASYIGMLAGLIALLTRVNIDEYIMSKYFNDAYSVYQRKTRKFIPFVW